MTKRMNSFSEFSDPTTAAVPTGRKGLLALVDRPIAATARRAVGVNGGTS